jgi:type VI secretion system protein ImpB
MGSESLQSKLDRVRRPRVHIKYEVETNGAMEMKELPFVVGVLADLAGQPKEPLKPLKERNFTMIDKENFSQVMEKIAPRAAMKVDNKLTDENTKLNVELNFKTMEDFDPARVAQQVPALRELLEMRQKLDHLLSKMEGNDKLEALLAEVLSNTEKAKALADQLGVVDARKEGEKTE